MKKYCPRCGEEKDLTEFHVNRSSKDGRYSICKACILPLARERMRRLEVRARENTRYAASAELRAKKQGRRMAQYHQDPTKYISRAQAQNAMVAGKLVAPQTCEMCGGPGLFEKHHDDYSKPLEVRWLCRVCHHKLSRVE